MNKNKKISYNKQDVLESIINLGRTHDIDAEQDSYLRTGTFGYITDSLATILKNSVLHKQLVSDEYFISSAKNISTVLKHARSMNIKIPNAIPAFAETRIIINLNGLRFREQIEEDEKRKYGYGLESLINKRNFAILDRDTIFRAGAIEYHLERSILIVKNGALSNNAFNVYYIFGEKERTNLQYLQNNNIDFLIKTINEQVYLSFTVKLYQYSVIKDNKIISSNSFLSNKLFYFNYENSFCGMTINYVLGNEHKPVKIVDFISQLEPQNINAYVEDNRDGTVRVQFPSGINGFNPVINSKLEVELITTLGLKGNINFSDNLNIILPPDSPLKSTPILAKFSKEISLGGQNAPDIQNIKNIYITELSTRETLVTQSDLNTQFQKLKGLINSVNKSEVLFMKKRDDLFKNTYGAYLLMKSNIFYPTQEINTNENYQSYTLPTTTFPEVITDSKNVSQLDGLSRINADNPANVYFDSYKECEWACPFFIHIQRKPFKAVRYIHTEINNETPIIVTKNNFSFTVNNGFFTRIDGIYFFGLKISGNSVEFVNFFINPQNDLETQINIYDGNNIIKSFNRISRAGFSNYDAGKDENVFTIAMKTENFGPFEIDENKNSQLLLKLNTEDGGNYAEVPNKIKIEFIIRNKKTGEHVFKAITKNELTTFVDLSNVMQSEMEILSDGEEERVVIKDVPAIKHKIIYNTNPGFHGKRLEEIKNEDIEKNIYSYINKSESINFYNQLQLYID